MAQYATLIVALPRIAGYACYANWRPVASADFDQNYEPIGPNSPGPVAGSYTVRNGDTLQSIAATVWGDSAMWYLIADANGLISGSTLSTNMVLIIPNKVTNIHNNAGTFRPYNPGEAMGDINPTLPAMPKPPKKKKGCGGLGAIIAAVVAVAVTFISQGTLGPVAAAMLGNVAGQVTGMALGVQRGFNFASFAMSGIPMPLNASAAGAQGVLNAAGNAALSNIAGQGLGIITGQQKGFSWASVAASAVGGAVGNVVGGKLNTALANPSTGNLSFTNNLFKGAVTNIASNVATQLTQIALDGKGKLSWTSVAVAGIYGIGSGLEANRRQEAQIAAQLEANKFASINNRLANDPNNKFAWKPENPFASSGFTGETIKTAYNSYAGFDSGDPNGVFAYANATKQPTAEDQMSLADRDSAVVRNGGLIVRTYKSEALANGGLVASYLSNKSTQVNNILELSGAEWVKKFPGSSSTEALLEPFKSNVNNFVSAIKEAGGSVRVSATYRPEERAYLMHYAYKVAKGMILPENVPPKDGVNIEWNHGSLEASKSAAKDMVKAYQIVYAPALGTRHYTRLAVDMTITKVIGKSVIDANNNLVSINKNADLYAVGATYGVKKLVSDKPHWSDNGH